MKIESIDEQPLAEIRFLNAGRGQGDFYVDVLPIHVVRVTGLPEDLDAIVATADLQGRERFQDSNGGPPRLLGEVLPDRLADEFLADLGLAPSRTGAVLAGDFYTVPNLDKRGGSGDVSEVWRAFARSFRWVAGVAGNHDLFEGSREPSGRIASNAHYLDGTSVEVDDVTVAGVGGIVGNPRKPHRKTDDDFALCLYTVSAPRPDIVVMHDGPNDVENAQKGSSIIRQTLEELDPTLVVRGHSHWHTPLAKLTNGTQVLNVDCRVAILCR